MNERDFRASRCARNIREPTYDLSMRERKRERRRNDPFCREGERDELRTRSIYITNCTRGAIEVFIIVGGCFLGVL